MRTLIFQIRRFLLFLTDAFLFPFRKLAELWRDPVRGRALLFGMPAVLVAMIGIFTALLAMGSHDRFVSNYEVVKNDAVKKEDWAKAIVYMRKLVQLKPDNAAAKWEFARILLSDDREDTREASTQTARAIVESLSPIDKPGYAPAHIMTARRIMGLTRISLQNRVVAAEKHLRLALEAEPGNKDALTSLADLEIRRGKYDEALVLYKQLFNEHVGYYVKIVELYTALKRPEEAEDYIARALVQYNEFLIEDPKNLDYLRRRANCLASLGRHEEAVQGLEQAINDADREAAKRILSDQLAKIYLSHAQSISGEVDKDPEQAMIYLNLLGEAYRADPENSATKIALTRFGLSNVPRPERAFEIYDPRVSPEDAPDQALQFMGTREITEGDPMVGVRLLEMSIQKNPSNHEALNNLAFTMMDTDLDRAFDLSNRAVSLVPAQHHYLDTRGNIHMRMGNYRRAINDLEKARIGMPDNINVYISLVYCYEQLGMMEPAQSFQKKIDELRANRDLDPGNDLGQAPNPGQEDGQ
ncbi:MAG: tetratricopeptide repeat protein [Pirellulaceae bacterium]